MMQEIAIVQSLAAAMLAGTILEMNTSPWLCANWQGSPDSKRRVRRMNPAADKNKHVPLKPQIR